MKMATSGSWCRLRLLAAAITVLCMAQGSGATSLQVPEELNPEVLSRQRRFVLPQSSGWKLTVTFKLSIPLQDLSTDMAITTPFTYTFDSGTVTGRRSSGRGFLSDTQRQREKLIQLAEDSLTNYVKDIDDGHACVLRLLCEMSEVPVHTDGMLGDAFSLLLTPSHIMDQIGSFMSSDDYLRAQKVGRYEQDCSRYHERCPQSIFEILHPDHPDYQYPGYVYASDADPIHGSNQTYPQQGYNEVEPPL